MTNDSLKYNNVKKFKIKGNKMYRTIEITDSEEVSIKLPKEYVNKILEIYVVSVEDNTEVSKGRERDFIDEYYH